MCALRLGLAVFSLLVVLPAMAGAEVLTFAMEGPITFKDDRLGLLDFAAVGDRMLYMFSFDTGAEDGNPTPSLGRYVGLSGSYAANQTTFVTSAPVIQVQEHDLFDILCTTDLAGQSARLMFTLSDQDHTAIPTAALPTLPYELSQFESKYFQLTVDFVPPEPPDVNFTRLTFGGEIDRFCIVPEPATAALVGLGLMGVILKRR